MAKTFSNDIKIGDTFLTESDEVYTYIGFYKGKPESSQKRPTCGYLYMFVSTGQLFREHIERGTADTEVIDNIYGRKENGIDNNATYCKALKKFKEKLVHTDISEIELNNVFGLTKLAENN